MYNISISGSTLPKKHACQITSFKFKNLEFITNSYSDLKKNCNKNRKNRVITFLVFFFFKTFVSKKKYQISISFYSKATKKKFILILRKKKKKSVKKRFHSKNFVSLCKRFFSFKSNFCLQRKMMKYCTYIFIQNSLKNLALREAKLTKGSKYFFSNSSHKIKKHICYFRFKKRFIRSFIGFFICFLIKLTHISVIYIYSRKFNCSRKILINLLQVTGKIIDLIPGGYKSIRKLKLQESV